MRHVVGDPLAGIVLGVGARDGYSGDDLTSPARALARGELPHLADGADVDVLELRIHGVGGAPPPDNLEAPATLQVAGDARAGFFRAWFPGGAPSSAARVEAYCWGKLNYQASWSALWLLLLPFGLVNVAHWALPADPRGVLGRSSAAVLRLLGLALTASFVGTTAYLLVDLVALQAAGAKTLWSWLEWLQNWSPGVRMALAGLVLVAAITVLWWLSARTQGHYEDVPPGPGAPDRDEWALSRRLFWNGRRRVVRQRHAHLTLAFSVTLTVLALPRSPLAGVRVPLLVLAIALAVGSVLAVASGWAAPESDAAQAVGARDRGLEAVMWLSLGLAAGAAVARFWWEPDGPLSAIPGMTALHTTVLNVTLGLVAVLLVLVWAQRRRNTEPREFLMARGFTSVGVALLAVLTAGIFSATVLMTAANLLGKPAQPGGDAQLLNVPGSVYACGFAFGVAAVFALLGAAVLWRVRTAIARELRTGARSGDLAAVYAQRGWSGSGPDAREKVATLWATSRLTDFAGPALFLVAVPTVAALVVHEVWTWWGTPPEWWSTAATFGTTAAVFVSGAFLLFLRSALTSTGSRKRVGFLWDVVTFWPRACHPFGPPSYAERSVPEVVTRIRRVVGDTVRSDRDPAKAQEVAEDVGGPGPREAHSPVLLVGYSQGTVIATAVVAQLPADVREKVALLTLAAPIRRLYGRAFPAYFGRTQVDELGAALADGDRWRNLVRRSDYIGGWVVAPPEGAVDREIVDPPVLWSADNPSPPPAHLHSDWFPDPQTRACAEELGGVLVTRWPGT